MNVDVVIRFIMLGRLGQHFFSKDTHLEFLLYYLTLPCIIHLRTAYPRIKEFDIWDNPCFLQRLGRILLGRGCIFNPEKCRSSLNWSLFRRLENLHRYTTVDEQLVRDATHNYTTDSYLPTGGRDVSALTVLPSHLAKPFRDAVLYCETKILRMYSRPDKEDEPVLLFYVFLPENAIDFAVSPSGTWIAVSMERNRILFLNLVYRDVLWTSDWFFQNESFSSHIFYDDQTIVQPTCDLLLVKRRLSLTDRFSDQDVYHRPLHQDGISVEDRLKMLQWGSPSWQLNYKIVHFAGQRQTYYLANCGRHHHKHKLIWLAENEAIRYLVFAVGAILNYVPTPNGDKLFILLLTSKEQPEIAPDDGLFVSATEFASSCPLTFDYGTCRHLVIYELDLIKLQLIPCFHLPGAGLDHPILQNDIILHLGAHTIASFKKMIVTRDFIVIEHDRKAFIFNHSVIRSFHFPYVVETIPRRLCHVPPKVFNDQLAIANNLKLIVVGRKMHGLQVKVLDPFDKSWQIFIEKNK